MSNLKSLIAKDRAIEVEYPDIDGFLIQLNYVNRDQLTKIRNRSLITKFNKLNRQREETVDDEKFLSEYANAAIKGWSGLKYKELGKLFPVDIDDEDPESEVDYNEDNALTLLRESVNFDQFVTDCMGNLELFEKEAKEEAEKN